MGLQVLICNPDFRGIAAPLFPSSSPPPGLFCTFIISPPSFPFSLPWLGSARTPPSALPAGGWLDASDATPRNRVYPSPRSLLQEAARASRSQRDVHPNCFWSNSLRLEESTGPSVADGFRWSTQLPRRSNVLRRKTGKPLGLPNSKSNSKQEAVRESQA